VPKSERQLSVRLLTKKAKNPNALLSVAYGFSLLKSHSQLYRNAFHPILNPLRYSWSTRKTMPSTLSATVNTVRRRERDGFLALR
jgi:hypothetical protein